MRVLLDRGEVVDAAASQVIAALASPASCTIVQQWRLWDAGYVEHAFYTDPHGAKKHAVTLHRQWLSLADFEGEADAQACFADTVDQVEDELQQMELPAGVQVVNDFGQVWVTSASASERVEPDSDVLTLREVQQVAWRLGSRGVAS